MSTKLHRSLGVALMIVGVVVLVTSTTIVDVPGPMAPSKPEFICNFSTPFATLALVLAFSGVVLLFRSRKKGKEP